MQQNPMEAAAEQFEQQLKKALQGNHLPVSPELELLWVNINDALRHESMATLGCSLDTYREVSKGSADLYSLSFAINCMQARTPAELNMDMPEYLALQDAVSRLAAEWNTIVEPLKNGLARKLQTQARISKGVPAGKIIGIA